MDYHLGMSAPSAASFVGRRGLGEFCDTVEESLVPQQILADRDDSFRASVSTADAAGATVLHTEVTPLRAHRRPDRGADDGGGVFLLHVVRGEGELSHRYGAEGLRAGSTLVIPAAERFDVSYARPSRLVFVALPAAVVDAGYARLRGAIRSVGLNATGASLVGSLAHVANGADDPFRHTAVRTALDVVASCPAPAPATASPTRARAERFIDERLDDPRLGVPHVAAALRVAPRTLERAFANEGVAGFIRERRLQAAAARLRARPSVPVAVIAAELGFGSASRFAEHFRRRFGVAPAAWRSAR